MKKYFAQGVVVLLVGAVLVFQWVRSDRQQALLAVVIQQLEVDLDRIRQARADLSGIEDEIQENRQAIQALARRIPPALREDVFAGRLSAQLADNGFYLVLESSVTRERDFYRETIMRFNIQGEGPAEDVLGDIFHNMERLVQWRLTGSDRVLETRIYSTLFDMKTARLKPCENRGPKSMNFWPFNAPVRQGVRMISDRCAARNRDAPILLKVEQLQNHRKYRIMLAEIVHQLEKQAGGSGSAGCCERLMVKVMA